MMPNRKNNSRKHGKIAIDNKPFKKMSFFYFSGVGMQLYIFQVLCLVTALTYLAKSTEQYKTNILTIIKLGKMKSQKQLKIRWS